MKVEVSGQQAEELKDLCRSIAAGALLNSRERSDAPSCHPETRVALAREKTTIMNTIGEHFKKGGNLAAAFFFSSFSPSPERRTKDRFVTTLVYQLIQGESCPAIKGEVLSSIARNPAIFGMSLKEQMEVLILRPLRLCRTRGDPMPSTQILLVDGLDECGQNPPEDFPPDMRDAARLSRALDQTEILDTLLCASSDPAFPFRIIIASRPEPAIDEFFSTAADTQSTTIFLDNKYNPDADIAIFLDSHFSRIRRKHRLPTSWPGDGYRQMIYAVIAIRFLETSSKSPRAQLEVIMENHSSGSPTSSNPFERLDELYARILNSGPDPKLAFMWLKAYQQLDIEEGLPTWCFNRLCESSEREADRLFANLSALVSVSHEDDAESARYTFYHKSSQDFFRHHSRYGNFLPGEQGRSPKMAPRAPRSRPPRTLAADLSAKFSAHVVDFWSRLITNRDVKTGNYDERLRRCNAEWMPSGRGFTLFMFVASHNKCHPLKPCLPECKRWRSAIMKKWLRADDGVFIHLPKKTLMLLDRFCLMRIPLDTRDFEVTLFAQTPQPRHPTFSLPRQSRSRTTSLDRRPDPEPVPSGSYPRRVPLEPRSTPSPGPAHWQELLYISNANMAPVVGISGMLAFPETA
ncbi:hypothetical protein FA13DRAFT_1725528 [Coprinellus micaceus]|uniref:Nephrocystin 3-like N-terminal domain-containing protein n=1 Tax=Coprinellus micaceus TaxID=71717 RepID=A0A4Y7TVJ8_COPMI|nr:hypothetical protein FA13DRAFT_1725528 [Coprinellus micaceus]